MEAAWSYIGLARRHRGPGKKQLRYFKEPIACGAEKKTMEVDGMTRTWYEYVPKSCTPDQKWPLVVVFHGRGGTAETFFDLSCVSTVQRNVTLLRSFPKLASISRSRTVCAMSSCGAAFIRILRWTM